MVLMENQCGST